MFSQEFSILFPDLFIGNMLLKSISILLVDDDPEDRTLLTETLLEIAPETRVHSITDGTGVLAWLGACPAEELPCLIILDYNMPLLSGAEVLNRLSSEPRYKTIPVVIWSTSSALRYKTDCLNKGASAYYVKPNKMEEYQVLGRKMLNHCVSE